MTTANLELEAYWGSDPSARQTRVSTDGYYESDGQREHYPAAVSSGLTPDDAEALNSCIEAFVP